MKKAALAYLLTGAFFTSLTRAQEAPQNTNPDYYETRAVLAKVESTNNYAGNFNPDSAATLPFGIIKEIGVARYVIAIDSAYFAPGKSEFNAYMALDFPGSEDKIAFAAKHIAFNPKGVVPGNNTRLMLVSEHKIRFGPNITLCLVPDGGNYVEWDCNGFKGVKLKGYFEFGRGILQPDSSSTNNNTVKANFDVYTTDVHNFTAQVSISPFCIKGLKDVSFTVIDAAVDMSDFMNPPGMVFPPGYTQSGYGGQTSLWTGFYMRQLKIKLPKELSKNDKAVELLASDFLIDKSGISGNFSGTNLFQLNEGKMGNWGFSVDLIGLNFMANQLIGGTLGGKILLPMNGIDGLAYTASVYENLLSQKTDYLFALSPASNYSTSVLSAKVDIYPTSKLIIQKSNGTFKPSAELNGRISFDHAYAKTAALEMQGVTITDNVPYLTKGVFSFTGVGGDSSDSKLSGFRISISSITLNVSQTGPSIGFGVGVNFTSKNHNAFGAAAGFLIATKFENVVQGGTGTNAIKKWSFDKVVVNDIALSIHTNAFKFDGLVKFKNNDLRYGNGFFGSLNLTIEKVMPNPATANVWFGNVSGFEYYYFDLAVPATVILIPPTNIPQGLAIYRFMGGLYYHMRPASVSQQNVLYTGAFGKAQDYVPDSTKGIGIKAGVTLGTYPTASILNGDIALEVLFTSSGGLGSIKFSGNAFMLVKIDDRVPTPKTSIPVKAAFSLLYDHENNVVHALMAAQITLPAVSGMGQAEFHIDANEWYIHFGKPDNRVSINYAGLATASSYIMLGNKLEPIPPPPSQVTNVFGHGFADTRDVTKSSAGNGLVMGASLGAGSSGEFGLSDFSVYYNLGLVAGFDVMAINYGPTLHCSGSTARAGFNGWYAQGQVYAALWGEVGARGSLLGKDFEVQLLSFSAAAMLGGKFPNPSSVQGNVAVDYDFLCAFHGHFDFGFQAGNSCNIVN